MGPMGVQGPPGFCKCVSQTSSDLREDLGNIPGLKSKEEAYGLPPLSEDK